MSFIDSLIILPKGVLKYQREEYIRLWFDLAKLLVVSMVLKTFEPSNRGLDWGDVLVVVAGLIAFAACVKMGLSIRNQNNK